MKSLRVYREEDVVKEKFIQESYKCPICNSNGQVKQRKGKQFRAWFCVCPEGHIVQFKKELDDIFQIGDRVRIYSSSFGKDAFMKLDTYQEGVIIDKEACLINFNLTVQIDKVIHQGKLLTKKSWTYGKIVRGIQSDTNTLELLTPQMKMLL